MRSLRRPRVLPPTLRERGRAAWLEHHAAPEPPREFRAYWLEPDVRGALRAMQAWACAYCQRSLSDGDEVDHFRPKVIYWWLAYHFSNLFLACHRCNSRAHKGTRFPLAEAAAAWGVARRDEIHDEPRLLVDPSCDPADAWVCVDVLDELPVLRPDPSLPVGGVARGRVEATVDLLRLNRDPDLLGERQRVTVSAHKLYKAGARDDLRRAASRYRPHGGTCLAWLRVYASELAPPSPEEELRWLLDDVDQELTRHAFLQRNEWTDGRAERHLDDLLWLLATLWASPPALDAVWIESWLSRRALVELVEPLRESLSVDANTSWNPWDP